MFQSFNEICWTFPSSLNLCRICRHVCANVNTSKRTQMQTAPPEVYPMRQLLLSQALFVGADSTNPKTQSEMMSGSQLNTGFCFRLCASSLHHVCLCIHLVYGVKFKVLILSEANMENKDFLHHNGMHVLVRYHVKKHNMVHIICCCCNYTPSFSSITICCTLTYSSASFFSLSLESI